MDKLQNILWSYGKTGAELSAGLAAVGTFLTALLGGWDAMLKVLLVCLVGDFILGFLAAVKGKSVDSKVMFWGGVNKLLVLCLVGLAVLLDGAFAFEEPYIRTMVIWFYIGREGLSMVENSAKLGLPWPRFVVALLEQLKDKGDNGKDKDGGTE